eukprot:comp43981_c0_seq1/m.47488 comp43981_c0_seq1/g.47488  ORF comp43981_c0_seq1/g.47488 comp43981_c0_seq1/m.47488 type:complete len:195 (-) comp43981_c0_seq1:254-838(-)
MSPFLSLSLDRFSDTMQQEVAAQRVCSHALTISPMKPSIDYTLHSTPSVASFSSFTSDRRKSNPDIFSAAFQAEAAKHTRRELVLRKFAKSDLGLKLFKIRNSIFISSMKKYSRAWHLGLSVGDRIEQVDDWNMAEATGLTAEEVYEMIVKAQTLELAVRDQVVTKEYVRQEMLIAKLKEKGTRHWPQVLRVIM